MEQVSRTIMRVEVMLMGGREVEEEERVADCGGERE